MSDYKPKKNHPNAFKYSKVVEERVRQGIRSYRSMKSILDEIAHLAEAPSSYATLYKIYGEAIADERAKLEGFVGGAFHRKIQEGDSKIIEFAARTVLGMNPTVKVQEVDKGEEEQSDAISTLARLLGKEDGDSGE